MYVVQIIAIVVILYLLVRIINEYRLGKINRQGFLLWLLVFGIFAVIAVFPVEVSQEIKNILGLGRGLDALFVVSIGLIFLLMFQLYIEIDKTKREITELTRKVAIELEEINERIKKLEEH